MPSWSTTSATAASADGWLHCLARYQDRRSGHAAETSFGAHIFNTLMTYRDEPQSYSGPPPGLSTRLFLKLGDDGRQLRLPDLRRLRRLAPACQSTTRLMLHDGEGALIEERPLAIACSGSAMVWPHQVFGPRCCARPGRAATSWWTTAPAGCSATTG